MGELPQSHCFFQPAKDGANGWDAISTDTVNLIAEAARDGNVRDDVATDELATYCLHALTAAGTFSSQDAVDRLVAVTLAGLRPAPAPSRAHLRR